MTKKKRIVICIILVLGLIGIPVSRSIYFFVKGFKAFINRCEGEAARQFEKSVRANPYFLEAYVYLALAYTDWASISLHYKEHDEAGFIQLKEETLGEAEKVLQTALKRFPYHPYRDDIQYMLGWMYDKDSMNSSCVWDRDKALKGYKRLIKKYPNSRHVKEAKERIEALEKDIIKRTK